MVVVVVMVVAAHHALLSVPLMYHFHRVVLYPSLKWLLHHDPLVYQALDFPITTAQPMAMVLVDLVVVLEDYARATFLHHQHHHATQRHHLILELQEQDRPPWVLHVRLQVVIDPIRHSLLQAIARPMVQLLVLGLQEPLVVLHPQMEEEQELVFLAWIQADVVQQDKKNQMHLVLHDPHQQQVVVEKLQAYVPQEHSQS